MSSNKNESLLQDFWTGIFMAKKTVVGKEEKKTIMRKIEESVKENRKKEEKSLYTVS